MVVFGIVYSLCLFICKGTSSTVVNIDLDETRLQYQCTCRWYHTSKCFKWFLHRRFCDRNGFQWIA